MIEKSVAVKVRVKDLLNSTLIRKQGWGLSYFEFNNKQVSKVNLIGIIVSIHETDFVVDDGTGSILVKMFKPLPENLKVGNVILIIGSLRQDETENFLYGEIVNVLNNKDWLKVRKQELKNVSTPEKKVFERIIPKGLNYSEQILELVKKLDSGEGASVDEVIRESNIPDCEKKIEKLILEGELFEIKQGRIKIL